MIAAGMRLLSDVEAIESFIAKETPVITKACQAKNAKPITEDLVKLNAMTVKLEPFTKLNYQVSTSLLVSSHQFQALSLCDSVQRSTLPMGCLYGFDL